MSYARYYPLAYWVSCIMCCITDTRLEKILLNTLDVFNTIMSLFEFVMSKMYVKFTKSYTSRMIVGLA